MLGRKEKGEAPCWLLRVPRSQLCKPGACTLPVAAAVQRHPTTPPAIASGKDSCKQGLAHWSGAASDKTTADLTALQPCALQPHSLKFAAVHTQQLVQQLRPADLRARSNQNNETANLGMVLVSSLHASHPASRTCAARPGSTLQPTSAGLVLRGAGTTDTSAFRPAPACMRQHCSGLLLHNQTPANHQPVDTKQAACLRRQVPPAAQHNIQQQLRELLQDRRLRLRPSMDEPAAEGATSGSECAKKRGEHSAVTAGRRHHVQLQAHPTEHN